MARRGGAPGWLTRLVLIALAGALAGAMGGAARGAEAGHDGAWLVGQFRTIADEGLLFQADRVAGLLELTFSDDFEGAVEACPAGPMPSVGRTVTHRAAPAWFGRASGSPPEGRNSIWLNYSGTDWAGCDPDALRRWREAALTIYGLPSLACVRRGDFAAGMHQAAGPESPGSEFHNGFVDEDSAAFASAYFRDGEACAWSITVNQDSRGGLRALRAEAQWRACVYEEFQKACALDPTISMIVTSVRTAVTRAAAGRCGTLQGFYEKEATGSGRPQPQRFSPSGCR